MKTLNKWFTLGAMLTPAAMTLAATNAPNIVFFLADDMGLGDTSAYQDLTGNPDARQIYTPNMERLAERGTRFTDMHAAAAVCTPSRISFLTGTYSFRSPLLQKTSFAGQDVYGTLFPGQRKTVPAMLRQYGYRTYGIGKWHIALQGDKDGTGLIYEGPLEVGFDRYTGTPGNFGGSGCMIQDHGYMWFNSSDQLVSIKDPSAVNWGANENPVMLKKIQPTNLAAIQSYLTDHMSSTPDQPFFVYYASHANHTPYVPADELDGIPLTTNVTVAGTMIRIATGPDLDGDGIPDPADPDSFMTLDQGTKHWDPYYKTNSVGEVIDNSATTRAKMVRENDIIVGDLLDFLEATDDPRNPGHKLIDNTLFIFTSDNGADIEFEFAVGALPQKSNGVISDIQGKKATVWEGGTRVPFIAVWPGRIATDATSDALFGLNDMYATFAEIIGHPLTSVEAPDSESVLSAWTNGAGGVVRSTDLLYKSKQSLMLRRGDLKLMTKDPDFINLGDQYDAAGQHLDFADMDPYDLYDLYSDLPELNDIISSQTTTVESMRATLQQFVDQGYSRSGAERVLNGPNFQGGSLLDPSNWHNYTPTLNNQLPTAQRPGFVCFDGTTASSVSNMFLIQRGGTVSFTGGPESQRQLNNVQWRMEDGSIDLNDGTLYLADGTSTLAIADGALSGAQLAVGGGASGSKTVVLEKGSGTITLSGQISIPPASADIAIVSEADQGFNAASGVVSTSVYSSVSVQAGDVIVLAATTNKKGSTAPLSPLVLGGTATLGPVTELHNGLDTYPTSWAWIYTVVGSGTVDLGIVTDTSVGITAGTVCYVLRAVSDNIALAAFATWDDTDIADNGTSYPLIYTFSGELTNGALIEIISARTDLITEPAAYTEDYNGGPNKRIIASFDGVTGGAWTSSYTLVGGVADKQTSGALGLVFQGLEESGSSTHVPPIIFSNDGDSSNDYISFTTGTHGRITSGEDASFYEALWTNGNLRIDGQVGTGSFADSGFLVINRGGGTNVLILDGGQVIDDDDDGINDIWEQRRAGGTGILTATGDYDHDGLLDITEYILDYDPLVSSQDFTCDSAVDVENLNFVIRFNATNSRIYRVEYKPDLLFPGTWQVLSQQTGLNGLNTFSAPTDATNGFFRIQVLVP